MRPQNEVITWFPCCQYRPDTETTVVCLTNDDYFTGWWDEELNAWFSADGERATGVLYWALLEGPRS